MTINKVICVYEGLPFWSIFISDQAEDMVLIGGFLSALNTFALQTEKKSIRNLTIGESSWTIAKIHNLNGFFLAIHADAFREDTEKRFKLNLIEKFILEIITEFTTQFPASYFQKIPAVMSVFNKIKEFSKKKMIQYNILLSQYQEQVNDTETNEGPNHSSVQTDFKCGLCNKTITFKITDETTYLSKASHQMYFGAELTTYKVCHYDQDAIHINSALVDKKGVFYDVIDSYSVNARDFFNQQVLIPKSHIQLLSDGHPPLINHRYLEKMVIIEKKKPWIMEVVGPSSDNAQALGLQVLSKTEEIGQIYSETTGNIAVVLNEKEFHLWNSGSIIVSACFKNDKIIDVFNDFAVNISHLSMVGEEWLKKRQRINLALQLFDKVMVGREDVPLLLRIITDDLLGIKLKTKYSDQIPRIVERLGREFILAKEVLTSLLRGQTSILELLEQNYSNQFRDLLSVVDFINRRSLFSWNTI